MKNKGVMISLASLVLIGMMITTGTHNFINRDSTGSSGPVPQVTAAPMDGAAGEGGTKAALAGEAPLAAAMEETARQEDGDGPGDGQPAGRSLDSGGFKGEDALPEGPAAKEAMPAGEGEPALSSGMEEAAGGPSPEAFGTPNPEEPGENAAADMAPSQPYYVKRLQDLDSQIQKNKENQTGANVNSSVKSAAANELKLWDSELNDIYNALLDRLGQEESEELVKEERAWLKERDSLAMDAAQRSAGGSSESIEYTISLMESTRQRAYELAGRYAQVLEE